MTVIPWNNPAKRMRHVDISGDYSGVTGQREVNARTFQLPDCRLSVLIAHGSLGISPYIAPHTVESGY